MKDNKQEDNSEEQELVNKYEQSLASNTSIYLDAEEIQTLTDIYIQDRNFEMAEQVIQLGERLFPANESLIHPRAKILFLQDKRAKALKAIKTFKQKPTGEYEAIIAFAHLHLGHKKQAQELFEQIILKNDINDLEDLIMSIGYEYLDKEEEDIALHFCEIGLGIFPNSINLMMQRANILGCNGQIDDAISQYQTVIRHRPDIFDAWVHLGVALSGSNREEESIKALQQALSLYNPEYDDIADETSINLLIFRNYLTLKDYDTIIALTDTIYHNYVLTDQNFLSIACQALKITQKWEKMNTICNEIIDHINHDNIVAYIGYAGYYEHNNDIKSLLSLLKKKYKQYKAQCCFDLIAHFEFVLSQEDETMKKKALADLRKSARMTPDNPHPLFDLGQYYFFENKYSKAFEYFKKVMNLNPDYHKVHAMTAALWLCRGCTSLSFFHYYAAKMQESDIDMFLYELLPDAKEEIEEMSNQFDSMQEINNSSLPPKR